MLHLIKFNRVLPVDPFKVLKTGPGQEIEGDPMIALQQELEVYKYVKIPEIPTFTGASLLYLILLIHFSQRQLRT
jgi:hypothetical protein